MNPKNLHDDLTNKIIAKSPNSGGLSEIYSPKFGGWGAYPNSIGKRPIALPDSGRDRMT
jgi:hypothetical protein